MRCVSRAAEVVVHLSEAAQQQPNMARVTLLALLLGAALLIRTAAAAAAAPAAQQPPPAVACPFKYERHTLVQIASKARRPYLFGGVYANGRPCPNCNRGGACVCAGRDLMLGTALGGCAAAGHGSVILPAFFFGAGRASLAVRCCTRPTGSSSLPQ
jgi:hypothetical protein